MKLQEIRNIAKMRGVALQLKRLNSSGPFNGLKATMIVSGLRYHGNAVRITAFGGEIAGSARRCEDGHGTARADG